MLHYLKEIIRAEKRMGILERAYGLIRGFYLCPLGLTTRQRRRRIISGSKEGMLSELLTAGAAGGGISNLGRMRAVALNSRRQRQED